MSKIIIKPVDRNTILQKLSKLFGLSSNLINYLKTVGLYIGRHFTVHRNMKVHYCARTYGGPLLFSDV